MKLEQLEQIGKQLARGQLQWKKGMVPKRYYDLIDAVERQEEELMEYEQQMAIDESHNRGWNASLYDLAQKRVGARNLQRMAQKRSNGDEISRGAYVSVVEDAILYEMRRKAS